MGSYFEAYRYDDIVGNFEKELITLDYLNELNKNNDGLLTIKRNNLYR